MVVLQISACIRLFCVNFCCFFYWLDIFKYWDAVQSPDSSIGWEVLGLWMAGLRENSSIGWRNRGSDEALVGEFIQWLEVFRRLYCF